MLAFTDTLHDALGAADASARGLNQEFVETEHLLLGLLQTPGAQALRTLQAAVNPAELKSALERALPRAKEAPVVTGRLPLSPRAQRSINGAIVIAQNAARANVSTANLLLSLLEETNGAVRPSLAACGADLDQLTRRLGEPVADPEP